MLHDKIHRHDWVNENEDQFRSKSMLSKLRIGECNDFWKEIKALNPKKEALLLTVGGASGESNIANLWKDHFSAIANSVGSTDNRDQAMNALGTVPGHNDFMRLLTIMSIFLSGCMISGKLPSTLMHLVIIPVLKCKSKDPADVNNYRSIAIATALSKVCT